MREFASLGCFVSDFYKRMTASFLTPQCSMRVGAEAPVWKAVLVGFALGFALTGALRLSVAGRGVQPAAAVGDNVPAGPWLVAAPASPGA